MAPSRRARRDVVLVILGAFVMYLYTSLFPSSASGHSFDLDPLPDPLPDPDPLQAILDAAGPPPVIQQPLKPPPDVVIPVPIDMVADLPETTIISHAPGWTIFRNLYMAEGTLYLVSQHPRSYFPPIRMMTSTGLEATTDAANVAMREPTKNNMDVISPQEAKLRWGGDVAIGERNRVWEIEGNTFLINDPPQFLRHYYHFVAELLLGAWAIWSGTFQPSSLEKIALPPSYLSHDPNSPPPFHRFIFANSDADGWRDDPGFNSYFLRAAFPSLSVEHFDDWTDRVVSTTPPPSPYNFANPDPQPEVTAREARKDERAWLLPLVLLADRSAAFRGPICGSKTQRTAAEAYEAMKAKDRLPTRWWDQIRKAMIAFAGAEEPTMLPTDNKDVAALPMPTTIVITYISRQGTKRRLIPEDHAQLVVALRELVMQKNREGGVKWELNVIQAEHMTKDAQVRVISKTTILLGVHGNGLTHLVFMAPTRVSTVIEMFIPGGFAQDYAWTTRALGMRHVAFWNDTHYTYENQPGVDYPEGFQGNSIPIYGPAVAQVIADRVAGKL